MAKTRIRSIIKFVTLRFIRVLHKMAIEADEFVEVMIFDLCI